MKLGQLEEKLKKNLGQVPEGTLRVGKSQGCVQYYHYFPGEKHDGIYIPKKNMELIKSLAQKTYDNRVLKCVTKRKSQISRILKDYEENEVERCYLCEHPERQKLITPIEPTFLQMIDNWISQPFTGKDFQENTPVILTNRGMRVRSKSEKIMADYFDSLGIAYKYECPLYLKPFGYVYPDFTFFSSRLKQEIYWEHEGMMDNPEYARSAIRKLELYEMNSVYPGERLILTFETSTSVINMNLIKELTKRYLI